MVRGSEMTGAAGVRPALEQYLVSQLGQVPDDDDALMGAGMLDSLKFVLFIAHIEQQLGMEVPEEDLTEDNFRTLGRVTRYLEGRGGG